MQAKYGMILDCSKLQLYIHIGFTLNSVQSPSYNSWVKAMYEFVMVFCVLLPGGVRIPSPPSSPPPPHHFCEEYPVVCYLLPAIVTIVIVIVVCFTILYHKPDIRRKLGM